MKDGLASSVELLERSEPKRTPLRITFVLPGNNRSGGVRVTVEMANGLLDRGHQVRIAYHGFPLHSIRGIGESVRRFSWRLRGMSSIDWLSDFKGRSERFTSLSRLSFEKGEIVIAVGSLTVRDVCALPGDVVKLRYCHGFPNHDPQLVNSAWAFPMPTVSVSPILVPRLEQLSGQKVVGVIPNGIDASHYFPEDRRRDGIGTIYGAHPMKAPEVTLELMRGVRQKWPDMPQYIFGLDPRPKELSPASYWRYPSIDKARELYNRSRIWLITSRSEGFCLPVLEAMACGCAVVSTEFETATGLISHGVNGFLVPVGGIEAFIERIDMLLKDEALRCRIVEKGFATARNFNWESAVAQMETTLRGIAARADAAQPREAANGFDPNGYDAAR